MSIEIIKARHTPAAFLIMFLAYSGTRYVASDFAEQIKILYATITYPVAFFPIALAGVGLQYLENKLFWCRFLELTDNHSFMGVSIGAIVGLLSLGL